MKEKTRNLILYVVMFLLVIGATLVTMSIMAGMFKTSGKGDVLEDRR